MTVPVSIGAGKMPAGAGCGQFTGDLGGEDRGGSGVGMVNIRSSSMCQDPNLLFPSQYSKIDWCRSKDTH